ncbi:ABC transporter substrate-binding protein [Desulfobacula phenolica]|uniref:Iron complex transport system substrate-binding protein n=1 Tax=Desulfobacula phenolica TaxID=90732 RepID=A0A1H2HJU1_9BACT|nr:ABC transporter substrate-binding protein [Desulfobacula phenolica]SDU32113.1 iron complex transport system substrate-binding protein [Desulfobacula phenolica]
MKTIKNFKPSFGLCIILAVFVILFLCGTKKSFAAGQAFPKRVISLSPIITETIYLVGAQDSLIANTTYCNIPEQAGLKEKIGSVTHMNVEKIISLCPDLVIASALTRERQLIILERQHITILRAENPKTFEQMCDMTLTIGQKLGKESTAKVIVEKARKEVAHVMKKTCGLKKPRVFLQIGLKPLHSANKDMFINEYIRYGGGVNIAEHESSGIYSREKVIQENPQVILIATMGTSKKAGLIERQRWMSFQGIDAVKNKRLHVLDPEMICSPTPATFVKGLRLIVPLIHPEIACLELEHPESDSPKSDSPKLVHTEVAHQEVSVEP